MASAPWAAPAHRGSGSSGGGSGSGSAANNKKLEEYSKCVTDAGGDTTKARKCADLLAP